MLIRWKEELLQFEWLLYIVGLIGLGITGTMSLTENIAPDPRPLFLNDATKWYEYKEDQVPAWAVFVFGVVGLLLCAAFEIIISYEQYRHKSIFAGIRVFLAGATGAMFAITICNIFKIYVGKLRPDFGDRCMGHTPYEFTNLMIPDDSYCTGDTGISLVEGRKSYPSGHATSAFAFGMFMTAHLLWVSIRLRTRNWALTSQLVTFLAVFPWVVAFWIACTRILDNKHEPEDLNGGAIVGSTMALLIFFPLYFTLTQEYCAKSEIYEDTQPAFRMSSDTALLGESFAKYT
jgi:diacylglycerol diphosphate phosphatase / phosphatidate phosphatase